MPDQNQNQVNVHPDRVIESLKARVGNLINEVIMLEAYANQQQREIATLTQRLEEATRSDGDGADVLPMAAAD